MLSCVNTWYDITVLNKRCFHLKCSLYVRYFLDMTKPKIQVIAINAFPKIYLNIKMTDFEVKHENILAGFISICDKIYVSLIMQHQI